MRTLQEKYNGIQEGKFSKDQFLVEARQQLPNLVTRYNGYDDAIQILKNRGMIQEAASFKFSDLKQGSTIENKFSGEKYTVTAVREKSADIQKGDDGKETEIASLNNYELVKEAKLTKKSLTDYRYKPTNDMDKYPYEQILRGLRVELETLGVKDVPTAEEYTKALSKVAKNLEKDSIYYTNLVAGVNPKVDLHDKLIPINQKELFKTSVAKPSKADGNKDTFNDLKKAQLKEEFKKLIKKILTENLDSVNSKESIIGNNDVWYANAEEKYEEMLEVWGEEKANKLFSLYLKRVDPTLTLSDFFDIYNKVSKTKGVTEGIESIGDKEDPLDNPKDPLHDYMKSKEPKEDEVENYKKEAGLEEASGTNDPKIQRLVDGINQLIAQAIDSDGDPIGVIEPGGTWDEPAMYSPIEYKNGALKITTKSPYKTDSSTETILARNMEYDGITTLRLIMRMYKKAVKKAGQEAYPQDKEDLDETATNDNFSKWRELDQDEKDHISKFVKDTGDRDQAAYEKAREERLKAQSARLAKYISGEKVDEAMDNTQDLVTFSLDSEDLDQILHTNFGINLAYQDDRGDSLYTLPQEDFDRFMDYITSLVGDQAEDQVNIHSGSDHWGNDADDIAHPRGYEEASDEESFEDLFESVSLKDIL